MNVNACGKALGRAFVVAIIVTTGCTNEAAGDASHDDLDAAPSSVDAGPDAAPSGVDAGLDAAPSGADAGPEVLLVPEDDDEFAIVDVAPASEKIPTSGNDGDLWPSCWSDDDALYAACGDGRGFDSSRPKADIALNRIFGSPLDASPNITGTWLGASDQISGLHTPGPFYRKPTGMMCLDGDIYVAVQSLSSGAYDHAPAATVVRSRDHGATWLDAPALPMFADHLFTTIMFLDFGKDGANAIDDYVYAYGLDQNWRFSSSVPSPTRLYLARVPRGSIQTRGAWEFFVGIEPNGPMFDARIEARKPVLVDESVAYAVLADGSRNPGMTKIAQGSIVYDAPLRRYVYTSWTEWTFEMYVAGAPWGPWKKLATFDFGMSPWTDAKHGGYATTIPSKFISADGRTMYVQANSWSAGVAHNDFSLRSMRLVLRSNVPASNAPGPTPLARAGLGVTPIARAIHFGTLGQMNDGWIDSQNEDSSTGEARTLDYWGYAFEANYRMNQLVYTTGVIGERGGWFDNLAVQVRVNGKWTDAAGLTVQPPYPNDATAGSHHSYTLKFDALEGDGIRITGKPGGRDAYTSVSELAVSYE